MSQLPFQQKPFELLETVRRLEVNVVAHEAPELHKRNVRFPRQLTPDAFLTFLRVAHAQPVQAGICEVTQSYIRKKI